MVDRFGMSGTMVLFEDYEQLKQENATLKTRVEELEKWKAWSKYVMMDDEERAEKAEADLALTRGAMAAQDDRERQAGLKCGVPYEQYGCDWPDAVAERLVKAEADLARLREAVERHRGDELNREPPGTYDMELYAVLDSLNLNPKEEGK